MRPRSVRPFLTASLSGSAVVLIDDKPVRTLKTGACFSDDDDNEEK
jgi:hypothetical protein